ncbi:unnamed protein product [Darwinula stevensoni]|uniref:TRAF1-6 MATH domain-containing protein n=1 Tax=Darwinula stevensoni TaxID=69355 RepID=A0A7R9A6V5_9CRUS|nr:unnamed protein product [Darwinula stevensoni]CAG0889099.1 unnamed protein product [Darwinula stevensoni]
MTAGSNVRELQQLLITSQCQPGCLVAWTKAIHEAQEPSHLIVRISRKKAVSCSPDKGSLQSVSEAEVLRCLERRLEEMEREMEDFKKELSALKRISAEKHGEAIVAVGDPPSPSVPGREMKERMNAGTEPDHHIDDVTNATFYNWMTSTASTNEGPTDSQTPSFSGSEKAEDFSIPLLRPDETISGHPITATAPTVMTAIRMTKPTSQPDASTEPSTNPIPNTSIPTEAEQSSSSTPALLRTPLHETIRSAQSSKTKEKTDEINPIAEDEAPMLPQEARVASSGSIESQKGDEQKCSRFLGKTLLIPSTYEKESGRPYSEYSWKIANFCNIVRYYSPDKMLKSDMIYMGIQGYRMYLVTFPAGFGGKGNFFTHVNLAAGMVSGSYDEHLQWPFKHNIRLTVCVPWITSCISFLVNAKEPAACGDVFQKPKHDTFNDPCGFILPVKTRYGVGNCTGLEEAYFQARVYLD